MNDAFHDRVKPDVLQMYMAHPYPSYSKEERKNIFAAELCRYRFLGLESAMRDARLADIGCGTGHRVMPMAQHFGVKEYVGLDQSSASLNVARELSAELGMQNVSLHDGDIFNLPFEDGSFDIVICQGVLHHTSDPFRGFKELIRICRPGGLVSIYLYNKFNHWRHNLQKTKVNRLGGKDIHKRFEIAHRLYGEKPVAQMTPAEIAGFFDQYCHPHKSDHSIGEVMSWFDREGLEYWGSYPPVKMNDFIGMAQYRGSLERENPFFQTGLSRKIVSISQKLPPLGTGAPPYRRPTIIDRFLWQAAYALQGSRGRYSGGPAFCGKKSTTR